MAEDLTEYLNDNGIKVRYLHSDIETLERIEIIRDLRLGVFDVLVGINLLREGLDIPECSLVAILDADKEGFLRSERSLIQTIGRAARNAEGRVILYADKMTGSLEAALRETNRRRQKQLNYNAEHGITPQTIKKKISNALSEMTAADYVETKKEAPEEIKDIDKKLREYKSLCRKPPLTLNLKRPWFIATKSRNSSRFISKAKPILRLPTLQDCEADQFPPQLVGNIICQQLQRDIKQQRRPYFRNLRNTDNPVKQLSPLHGR